jgi:ubiquinone/menaquinone biosynthesis C-methylase UbiE
MADTGLTMQTFPFTLDVGCGNHRHGTVGIDLEGKPDVKCDAHHLPFRKGIFDGCYAHAVLEHVNNPFTVLKEINRVLKPKQWLEILVPTDSRLIHDQIRCFVTLRFRKMWRYREDAKALHKWQYTEIGLRRLCESTRFSVLEVSYPKQPLIGKTWKIGTVLSKMKLTVKPHIIAKVKKHETNITNS